MKVFIVGAGEVGIHIASSLVREGHDLVVIEKDSKKVSNLQKSMDILAVAGDGCNPRLLKTHGAADADLFFAVSNNDSVNLLSALTARKMGAARCVVRVGNPELGHNPLLKEDSQILQLYPERLVAEEIFSLTRVPGEEFKWSDDLIAALHEGRGDIAAGILTVTPQRLAQVDFGGPFFRGVKEIVVTGPRSPDLASADDLSGKQVFVRRSASYWTHLEALNKRFKEDGRKPVKLRAVPESLQDEDLLEMLNAGLIGLTVVDRYVALLWAKVFKNLKAREDIVINEGGEIGWMIRKNNPKLKAEIDAFAKKYGQGTLFGNSIVKKYTGSTRFVKPSTSPGEMKKFRQKVKIFQKYGDRYDMDYLLMMAQGYQESRLDQSARSPSGAIGVMQVLPSTGKAMGTGDIRKIDPNIHAGVKYIRFVQDRYFEKEPMDSLNKTLFSFASYNAGPARVQALRREAEKKGFNPNLWFNHVEVAAAMRIGPETVTYVSNIFKYYIAYKLVAEDEEERRRAREGFEKQSGKK